MLADLALFQVPCRAHVIKLYLECSRRKNILDVHWEQNKLKSVKALKEKKITNNKKKQGYSLVPLINDIHNLGLLTISELLSKVILKIWRQYFRKYWSTMIKGIGSYYDLNIYGDEIYFEINSI